MSEGASSDLASEGIEIFKGVKVRHYPRARSIEAVPTLGPNVWQYYLLGALKDSSSSYFEG